MTKLFNKGISLLEIIIIIAIITIIVAITLPNFSEFKKQQALQVTKEDIISFLNEARNMTISSKNSTTYGIRFESNRATLFPGDAYVDSIINKQINFDQAVIIPNNGINLSGGGIDVIFKRITGDTINHGTIVIQLVSDETAQKVININSLGVISSN